MLSLPEREHLMWFIVLSEARGAKWDYKRRKFSKPIPPKPVYAIMSEMKE